MTTAVPIEPSRGQPNTLAEPLYRRLVEAVTDYAIFMITPEGRIISWNAGAERIKGYRAEDVLGQHFSAFYTDEDRASGKPQRALKISAEAGRFEDEGWRQRKDGTRFWASVIIDPVRDDDGQLVGFTKITRDITERKQAQEALEQVREQLFQSQKLEALGQLTGGIAHDFNNLLGALLSGIALVERRSNQDPQIGRLLSTMRQALHRGQGLIQQLLAFARRQALQPEVVDISKLMAEFLNLLERLVGGNIRTRVDLPLDLWRVNVDPSQFELAVLNLCLNARDAMPNGGTLSISARNVPASGDKEDAVAITISDTGTGIPEALLPRVFEPFFTTKGVDKGSGLGLSQVYGFATHSGGSIDISSKVDVGTTVTLRVPASTGVEAERTQVRPPSPQPRAYSGNILLIEDELALANLSSAFLEDAGFTVTIAHSARAALTILNNDTPVDAVFSDIVMPGDVDGIELAATIRRAFPHLPILLTTGLNDAARRAQIDGIDILPKPYDPARLCALLDERISAARRRAR